MKIGFFEIEGWEEKNVNQKLNNHQLYFYNQKIDDLLLPENNDFDIISIFVDSKINSKVLDYFPNLKCITTRSTGFDHIDIEECKKRNISVLYVPGYGDNTVAEFTFGLILNLTRKIYQAIDQIKESAIFDVKNLRGTDLKGKTIGIIGTGRIGREAIKIAKGFGMNVLAYDPYPNENFAKEIGYSYVNLDDLLANSDIISIHCPYSESTHHLINKNNILKIKKGAYLINTARGAIVETESLILALDQKILAGAGLDVLEEEGEVKDELFTLKNRHPNEAELKTIIANHILMKMPNVLITPHNAFNSQEALERILNITIENILSFINGAPQNKIN
ncbi:MAG: hydroxyacid dehydrogenase [Patescibacteria group bacterium]|nr:hydroxyacid dehydrogenase [Patescibacteria group bacterium]MDW8279877.1 NAD(P)-dependent oxidoreductase [bacterium]